MEDLHIQSINLDGVQTSYNLEIPDILYENNVLVGIKATDFAGNESVGY